ncbi:hypothetical protein V5799_028899 [Amblyomma americanum]|uniref:Uncharacterized protein n=1 Tax=Amblyomma americanum TaxID=6943 RepID=A0AAQ4DBJ4_AMBAM
MYTYALSQFIDWSQLALCCAVPSILTAVLLVRAVESPRWLMEQGRRGDAQAAQRRLPRYASLADSEFEIVFSAAFSACLGPASWVLAVELAPLRASGFDFGSMCAFYWASALAVVSLFATLGTDPHSLAVLSWVCGAVTFAGGVTTFAFAPETVGISVESILMEGQDYKPKKKKSDTVEAATSSVTPRPDEAKALSQHKENSSRARLGVPAAEKGHTAGVESAAEALAEDDDRHQEQARALPDEVLRSGAISSSHSVLASTPSIHMSGSGRQK